jgi:hypothetical protein
MADGSPVMAKKPSDGKEGTFKARPKHHSSCRRRSTSNIRAQITGKSSEQGERVLTVGPDHKMPSLIAPRGL